MRTKNYLELLQLVSEGKISSANFGLHKHVHEFYCDVETIEENTTAFGPCSATVYGVGPSIEEAATMAMQKLQPFLLNQ